MEEADDAAYGVAMALDKSLELQHRIQRGLDGGTPRPGPNGTLEPPIEVDKAEREALIAIKNLLTQLAQHLRDYQSAPEADQEARIVVLSDMDDTRSILLDETKAAVRHITVHKALLSDVMLFASSGEEEVEDPDAGLGIDIAQSPRVLPAPLKRVAREITTQTTPRQGREPSPASVSSSSFAGAAVAGPGGAPNGGVVTHRGLLGAGGGADHTPGNLPPGLTAHPFEGHRRASYTNAVDRSLDQQHMYVEGTGDSKYRVDRSDAGQPWLPGRAAMAAGSVALGLLAAVTAYTLVARGERRKSRRQAAAGRGAPQSGGLVAPPIG